MDQEGMHHDESLLDVQQMERLEKWTFQEPVMTWSGEDCPAPAIDWSSEDIPLPAPDTIWSMKDYQPPPKLDSFPNFLLLPLEIRDKIYAFHLDSTILKYQGPCGDPKGDPYNHHQWREYYLFSLAFVSRAISEEFIDHVYRNVPFVFHLYLTDTGRDWSTWEVSEHVLSRIRHCRFSKDVKWDNVCDEGEDRQLDLSALTLPLKELKVLELEVVLYEHGEIDIMDDQERNVKVEEANDEGIALKFEVPERKEVAHWPWGNPPGLVANFNIPKEDWTKERVTTWLL